MITEGLMRAVFEWIRNLTGFFLFMSVMDHLMPEKAYASYIRLFSGMVFILLVLQPITGNRKLEERIAQYYESNLFRYETGELRENLLGVEEKRRTQMVNQYEEALSQEISKIAQADGFEVRNCRVKINQDMDSEQFGEVTGVRAEVCSVQPEQSAEIDTELSKNMTKNDGADKSEIQISKITVENIEHAENAENVDKKERAGSSENQNKNLENKVLQIRKVKKSYEIEKNTLEMKLKDYFSQTIMNEIYQKIDPHEIMKNVTYHLNFNEKDEPQLFIEVCEGEESSKEVYRPETYFSTAQLNTVAFSSFFGRALSTNNLPVKTICIDDPIGHFDDMNILGFTDMVRCILEKQDCQIIMSTHEEKVYQIMKRKLDPNFYNTLFIQLDNSEKVIWNRANC